MKIRLLATSDLPMRVEWMNNPRIYKTMHLLQDIHQKQQLKLKAFL